MIKSEMLFQRNPEISGAELDGEICAFIPSDAEYITLNETASEIWKLLEIPKKIDEIVYFLLNKYDISEKNCKEEVIEFINYGIKIGLIIND